MNEDTDMQKLSYKNNLNYYSLINRIDKDLILITFYRKFLLLATYSATFTTIKNQLLCY